MPDSFICTWELRGRFDVQMALENVTFSVPDLSFILSLFLLFKVFSVQQERNWLQLLAWGDGLSEGSICTAYVTSIW